MMLKLALVLALFIGLRVLYLITFPLNLSPDEAYYWDWSRHLDWCYYSKPPMVAWLIALSTELLGNTEFAVRIPAVVLQGISLIVFFATARILFGTTAGIIACLLYIASPGSAAIGIFMTIDAPMLCFWSGTLYFLTKSLLRDHNNSNKPIPIKWWIAAGAMNALALLSKQTAVALPIFTGLMLMITPALWHHFNGFMLYLLTTMLALIPIVYWNSQHGWITFVHTSSHFENNGMWHIWQMLYHFVEYNLTTMGIVSPVTGILIYGTALLSLVNFFQLDATARWLFFTGGLPLLGIWGLSLFQRILPNWPGPFYLAGILLLAGWLTQQVKLSIAARGFQQWIKPAILVGITLFLLALSIPWLTTLPIIKDSPLDIGVRLRKWDELVAAVQKQRQIFSSDKQPILLVVGHRYLVSMLAFYLPDQPQVYRFEQKGGIHSQYEVWPGPIEHIGKPVLIVSELPLQQLPIQFTQVFFNLQSKTEINIATHRQHRSYWIIQAEALQTWPP